MTGVEAELHEPSDVSSDALSSFSSDDEEESRHRAAAHVNILDLPSIDNNATRGEREQPDLTQFRAKTPFPSEIDSLSETQLDQVVQWAQNVSVKLQAVLSELESDHAAEWLAKEQALNKLMEASIGDRQPPL